LNRTRKQAIGGYCGLTGVCGIAPAIGACFSVILGAACPKDQETAATMKVVGRIVNAIADQTGPCCCKNFVRTALNEALKSAKEYLHVSLASPGRQPLPALIAHATPMDAESPSVPISKLANHRESK
ncbi:MAG: DUF5714 domain-containing protein, partial [Eubacteriales bacterium]